jgi:hypothetical protein
MEYTSVGGMIKNVQHLFTGKPFSDELAQVKQQQSSLLTLQDGVSHLLTIASDGKWHHL